MAFPILGTPFPQFEDSSGSPFASGTLAVVEPADDTNKASYPTYDDAEAATNANDNPMTLDASGRTAVGLWGLDGQDYKITIKDSAGATVWTSDDIFLPTIKGGDQLSTDEDNASLTASDISTKWEIGDLMRYKAALDGTTDDTTAVGNWLDVGAQGVKLTCSVGGTALLTTWTLKTIAAEVVIDAPLLTLKGPDTDTDFISFTTGPFKCRGVTFERWDHNVGAGKLTADTYFELINCKSKDSIYFFNHKDADTTAFKVSMLADGCIVDHGGVAAATGTRGIRVFTEYEDIQVVNCRFLDLNGSAVALGTNEFANQDVFSRAVVSNNIFDGIIEPDTGEVHAIIIYGRNAIINNNTIKDVVNSTDGLSSEGIYTKTRYATIVGNSLIDAGEDEAAINIKGSNRAESVSPRGHNVVCAANEVFFTSNTECSGIHVSNEDAICAFNTVEGADTYGIYTEAKTLNNIKILYNEVRKCKGESGIWIQNDGVGLDIIGNTVDELDSASSVADAYGIFVDPASGALSQVKVKDNYVSIDDGSAATSTVRGIHFQQDHAINDVQVIGNTVKVSHASATEYGINLSGATLSDNWTIKDNDWSDTDDNGFTNLGTALPTNMDFEGRYKVQTTDATATNIMDTLPVSDNTAWHLETDIIAMESDGSDRNLYRDGTLVYKDGGALTKQGSTYNLIVAIESDAAWSISIGPVSGNIGAQVNGAAATTINWHAKIRITSVA